ncbi:MAG TPA: DUF3365 domain-containing protein [Rhodocyclaceae bacterium]
MVSWRVVAVAALSLFAGAASAEEDIAKLNDEARRASVRLLDQLRSEVVREMDRAGPLRAIVVCKFSAPEVTATLSRQYGEKIARISLKPRNRALGEADAWEQTVLLDFEKRVAKGEKAENLEYSEIVREPAGRFFRYLKAIPMGPACVSCHGTGISEAVHSVLASEYPHDKAVDYAIGQVRGAVTIKKPL